MFNSTTCPHCLGDGCVWCLEARRAARANQPKRRRRTDAEREELGLMTRRMSDLLAGVPVAKPVRRIRRQLTPINTVLPKDFTL